MVTLCKGKCFAVHLISYPSGVCLEVDIVNEQDKSVMGYSEGIGSIVKIAERLKEGKIGQ
jgi:hypothetical protein